jgi:hypothetical protein
VRNIKFNCVITCDLTPTLELQEQVAVLKQEGKKWSGSITVGVDHLLLIYCRVAGITGEQWSIDITTDCPGGTPDKIYSDSDKIPHGGAYEFFTSAKVPDLICGKAVGAAPTPAAGPTSPNKARKGA